MLNCTVTKCVCVCELFFCANYSKFAITLLKWRMSRMFYLSYNCIQSFF